MTTTTEQSKWAERAAVAALLTVRRHIGTDHDVEAMLGFRPYTGKRRVGGMTARTLVDVNRPAAVREWIHGATEPGPRRRAVPMHGALPVQIAGRIL